MGVELEVGLLPDRGAPARARRAARTFAGVVPDGSIADLELLVSELVTNAVKHAAPGDRAQDAAQDAWIRLRIAAETASVRVEVTDPGGGGAAPALKDARDGLVSGWGLVFVDRLSERWGIDDDQGTTVWFELRYPGTDASAGLGRRLLG